MKLAPMIAATGTPVRITALPPGQPMTRWAVSTAMKIAKAIFSKKLSNQIHTLRLNVNGLLVPRSRNAAVIS
jgi:hypothetical protein